MATFNYKAKDKSGVLRTGTVKANNKEDARKIVSQMRLIPLTIKLIDDRNIAKNIEKNKNILGGFITIDKRGMINFNIFLPKSPTDKDLIIFTKQFSTMLSSGLALIQAINILSQQQRVHNFGRALESIRNSIENGSNLSSSLEQFPKIFDTLYVAMVRAGEASGKLDEILSKLVTYIEKSSKIRSQIRSAMFYPAIVFLVATAVVSALLIFVVPTFAKQYSDSGQDLPTLTDLVVRLSNFLIHSWHILFLVMFSVLYLMKKYINTTQGREKFDRLILYVPGIGELIRKISVGRFCNTMATMLTSGINLLEALNICAASSGNTTVERFILNVRSKIEQGSKISDPLSDGDLFPPMVVSMVAVGEATGALDQMLHKVSEFYEEEVDLAVKTLLSLIEPFMIIFIGGIVGVIVIAMYLPVFDMANLVTN